ncbi:MAG TPA: DUF4260 domain-containing protein [Herpetosiphonaceae bacterium]|nr:DUF4260 domain-containing protein [Herpetosiphonaceae bacterium]
MLHLEGLTALAAATAAYWHYGFGWWWFAGLLLAPDLAMIAYLINPRVGSCAYNVVHTYALPLALGLLSLLAGWQFGGQLALIWLAHIGMDRALGYGLKYATDFKDTHLGRV